MAAHVVVINASFLKATIKVTPGTFMTDVLEEACTKFKVNASNYALKHKNKPIDLSRPFRQTGLSSGAKLELVAASRTPTVISVALQVPEPQPPWTPSGRLIEKFATDTTIWKILRQFEDSNKEENIKFTARAYQKLDQGETGPGRLFYEMPKVRVMNRDLMSFGDLQKTLSQLGLTGGNCLLNLSFQKTDQPWEEAMGEIETYFKDDEPMVASDPPSSTGPAKEEPASVTEEATGESSKNISKEDVEMTSEPAPVPPTEELPKTVALGATQRPVSVFAPPSTTMPRAAQQPHNEKDYEPSIAHAKLHQSRLLNNSQNKRLLSDAEAEKAEEEKAAKLAAATQVNIKVRFPDQSTIVSTFTAQESGLDLYKFVTDAIVAEDAPFKLVYTHKGPPQTVPREQKKLLIKHLGLTGSVLVNFHWADDASPDVRKQQLLKSPLLENAQEVKVPELAVVESKEEEGGPSTVVDKGKGKETSGDGAKKGLPKWFLAGKKK